MVELRERVYNFMSIQGPVVPIQVAKYIENESYVASAVLSELLGSKRIRISNKSVGSSRLYYLPGQETKVGDLLYPHLNSREKDAYNLLKENSVLKDTELEPWCRVALRDLKDFAFGLLVETPQGKEGFWKFSLVSDSVASDLIKSSYFSHVEVENEMDKPIEEVELQVEEVVEEVIVEPIEKKDLSAYVEVVKPKLEGVFYKKIRNYFDSNSIEIVDETLIKKNKEFGFIVLIPSNIGKLVLFVYAKEKSSITENDIALAYVEAQRKRMICLFLSTGSITKKTVTILENKYSGSLVFKKV